MVIQAMQACKSLRIPAVANSSEYTLLNCCKVLVDGPFLVLHEGCVLTVNACFGNVGSILLCIRATQPLTSLTCTRKMAGLT